jgi:HEPN domain-containing protein
MKPREQALLLLRKAAQDEAVLDHVLESIEVSDEIIGFHCQQAAEKLLKALLSDLQAAKYPSRGVWPCERESAGAHVIEYCVAGLRAAR